MNVDIILANKVITKIVNLKLVIMWEYENIKPFLLKVMFQIGQKKLLSALELKEEEIIETFYEKQLPKTNQKEFSI